MEHYEGWSMGSWCGKFEVNNFWGTCDLSHLKSAPSEKQTHKSKVAMAAIQECTFFFYTFHLIWHLQTTNYLLPTRKRELSGRHFDSDDDVTAAVDEFLSSGPWRQFLVLNTDNVLGFLKLYEKVSFYLLPTNLSITPRTRLHHHFVNSLW